MDHAKPISISTPIVCSSREFGDGSNLFGVRLSEVNFRSSSHGVNLLRIACFSDRSGHVGMAQSPGNSDGTRETVVALADRT